jgi:hypothetical protein
LRAGLVRDRVAAGLDRADLLEDAVDVGRRHEALIGADQRAQLVADRPLKVAQDLRPVGIALQARGGSVEVPRGPRPPVKPRPGLGSVSYPA